MNELWTPLDDSNWTPEFQPSYPSSAAREPPRVALACAADIVPVPIKWLWPGWLACGKLHILGGSPGTGKTTLAIEMAAIVTRGD